MNSKVFNAVRGQFQRQFDPKETLQWLKANQPMFWSWGVDKMAQTGEDGTQALMLSVHGAHFKGIVVITLAWNDTYTVTFVSRVGNVKETKEMVYCDMLAETIDKYIEWVPAYKK